MNDMLLPAILLLLAAVAWMQVLLLRRGRIRLGRWRVTVADGRSLRHAPRTASRRPARDVEQHSGSAGAAERDPADDRERARPAESTGLYDHLRSEVRTVSDALERQTQQLNALRTDFRGRLQAIEEQLRRMSAAAPAGSAAAPPASAPASSAPGAAASPPREDEWLPAVETHAVLLPAATQPSLAPPSSGTPVEVRDGVLVVSQTLPPAAFLVREGPRARLFLNADMEINEYALPKWEAFFDLRGARPYATYRTVRAAEVSWDAQGERGTPAQRGIAEAV